MSKGASASESSDNRHARGGDVGISNRESAAEESAERAAHPPVDTGSAPPEDAASLGDEQTSDESRDLKTSRKTGSRSTTQKETASRYPDKPVPASKKVPGAFGKEPV